MKQSAFAAFAVLAITTAAAAAQEPARGTVVLTDAAQKLHGESLVFDGHNDLPWELRAQGSIGFERLDLAQRQKGLHTDIPKLRQGGVGAQFWSVYVPASTDRRGTALVTTLEQIELVHAMVDRYPQTFELALTADDVRRIYADGKIASLIGLEGGHSIENSLGVLRQLFNLGCRYMTLTHSDSLDWADSATDAPKSGGLSEFGEDVVREMNRLGMLVDLSHVSPATMKHSLRVTKAPVIFSHSSAVAVADHPRNVPDDVLRLVDQNNGVVMVNFYSAFVVPQAAARDQKYLDLRRELENQGLPDTRIRAELTRWAKANPTDEGTIHDLIDHIVHIAEVAGVEHVGLGSDYDGVSILPKQLENTARYPYITQALLDRGFSPEQVKLVLGENVLRVMDDAERVAAELQAEQPLE
ncbi:MAG: dipeptidase [Planctomycetota bacterium]